MRAEKSTIPVLLVGIPEKCPDLLYEVPFRAPDPIVLLETGRVRHVVVNAMEAGRARATLQGYKVYEPAMLGLEKKRVGVSEWALALVKKLSVQRVKVNAEFPLAVARRLQRSGIRVCETKGALFPRRAVKTARELRALRCVQRAAVKAMGAACRMIGASQIRERDGVMLLDGRPLTSERVRRRINHVLLDLDCLGGEPIVAGGRQGADPHQTGHGLLRAREPIVLDIFPQHQATGCWGDITRTVVHGQPKTGIREMYRAVRAAQARALTAAGPGVWLKDVYLAAADELKRRGFKNRTVEGRNEGFTHGIGHGVGLEIHEALSLTRGRVRLRPGNVVTIEPGLYYADRGGMRIEDTIEITKDGWRYLATCGKKLECGCSLRTGNARRSKRKIQ